MLNYDRVENFSDNNITCNKKNYDKFEDFMDNNAILQITARY